MTAVLTGCCQDLQTAALFAPLLNGTAYGSLLTGAPSVGGSYPAHHRPSLSSSLSTTYGGGLSTASSSARNHHSSASLQNGIAVYEHIVTLCNTQYNKIQK